MTRNLATGEAVINRIRVVVWVAWQNLTRPYVDAAQGILLICVDTLRLGESWHRRIGLKLYFLEALVPKEIRSGLKHNADRSRHLSRLSAACPTAPRPSMAWVR
jgi:hypothetical protein